jgi:hypothetical protein
MDFVFYQDKKGQKTVKVLSFIEQNDQFSFQLDEIFQKP